MFLILCHPHAICWEYVFEKYTLISLSFTVMCTCMWSVKTSTLHVWRTKNTGTHSQQIISSSLKVRVLGNLWRLQSHSKALLSFCCKFVFTNLPLCSCTVFRHHWDAGNQWKGCHQRRNQRVVEATSPLSRVSQRASHHTSAEGTHQVSLF